MIAGVLGVAGLALGLFVAGSLMEGNIIKAAKFGAALAACLLAIFTLTNPSPFRYATNCTIEWDGRANSEVCD